MRLQARRKGASRRWTTTSRSLERVSPFQSNPLLRASVIKAVASATTSSRPDRSPDHRVSKRRCLLLEKHVAVRSDRPVLAYALSEMAAKPTGAETASRERERKTRSRLRRLTSSNQPVHRGDHETATTGCKPHAASTNVESLAMNHMKLEEIAPGGCQAAAQSTRRLRVC
jgi:hypothetical protein